MASPVNALVSQITDTGRHILAQRKPWSELADRTAYAKPADFAEATGRIRKNVNYFKINYMIFVFSVLVLFLLTNPFAMFLLFGIGASWVYLFAVKKDPLVINGRELSEREKLIGMSATSIILIFFLTSVGNVMFGALGVGLAGVAIHGSFRVPDDLFLDEAESNTGFFSFLNKPAAGQPPIV
mmetsp:Transcript_23833/g.28780  ORF Transcript_23833/g.28780 Transcript_23833/m.28780 type:complete len:183 (+) Transcript_23833:198-746(+)|eukprot:CAMPEP_0197846830 /NCGR_PEP_ID=MMETSP1438-20131217/4514_1 /TAXON_ID=1461541 /ORGANISM="Pterosperma sp., Strain CCMP1384" /LENGTH=182 /DNA_ID=CAMNT_0043458605 /DNA_START=198 /DNA_END=746 /DNA_ORIENTATION=+